MDLISRKEATEKGLKRYFTGEPCKHGHISERLVSTHQCSKCLAARHYLNPQDPIKRKQWRADYYSNNRDRELNNNRLWRELNPEKSKAATASWQQRNPHKMLANNAMRRGRMSASDLTTDERRRIASIYLEARRRTKETSIQHHVDHIQALSRGGKHHPDNLQVLTAFDNQSKNAKDFDLWCLGL